jgi:hypothetical protein
MWRKEAIAVAHFAPGSQTRDAMEAKEELIRRLLAAGLTVTQVRGQTHCSSGFIRKVRAKMRQAA